MLEGGDRQLGEPPPPVVGLGVDALQAHADDLVEERPHEVVLAAEVAVDRRRVGAELGAEVAHRDGAHARLRGELEPGGHDRLAVEARLAAAAASRAADADRVAVVIGVAPGRLRAMLPRPRPPSAFHLPRARRILSITN